ncbi:Cell division protein FtsA [compost metagenome]
MPGVLKAAQSELSASVRIAVPDYIGVRDPGYTGGVGILHHVVRSYRGRSAGASANKKTVNRSSKPSAAPSQEAAPKQGFVERLKNIFSDFI